MDLSFDDLKIRYEKIVLSLKHWQFSNRAQLGFLEDLYLLINDGIPANRAIEMMGEITTGLTREVAISIGEKITQGQPLAEGMRDWFSQNIVEIVRVGESGGALAQTLKSAINTLSQRGVAIGAFIGALAYPIFVLVVGCGVIIYLNDSVFVQFRMIKPMDQWPESGQRLVEIANVIESWWWVVLLSIGAITVTIRQLMTRYVGELRPFLDKFPPFSIYRRFIAARFLETLGLLVANGVVFKSAIKIMQYHSNPYLASHLRMMERLLGMGKTNIADVLDTGLINDDDLMRLRVMAEVKGFEHGLIRMGVRGSDESTATMKLISRLLGGVFLSLGGLLVILIVQGIYTTGMVMGS